MDDIEATPRIVATPGLQTRVLILTTFDLDEYAFEALRVGASGFLLKDASPEELVHAIRTMARGVATLAPSITHRLVEAYVRRRIRTQRSASLPVTNDDWWTRRIAVLDGHAREHDSSTSSVWSLEDGRP